MPDMKTIPLTPLQDEDAVLADRTGTGLVKVALGTFANKDVPTANATFTAGDATLIRRGTAVESIPHVVPEPLVTLLEVSAAARDLAISDDRKALRFTHATPVLTIPAQTTTAFPAGFFVWPSSMVNGGTITAATGVTLNGVSAGSFAVGTEATGIMFWLRRIAENVWLASSGGGGGGGGDMAGDEIAAAMLVDLSDTERRAHLVAMKGVAISSSSPAQATGALITATATAGEGQWATPVTLAPATGAELIAGASNTVLVTPSSFGSALGLHAGTVASGAMDINLTTSGFLNWTGSISANTDVQFDAMPSTWAGRTVTVLLTNTTANARTLTVSDTAAVTITVGNDVPGLITPAQINATTLLVFYVAAANHMVLTAAVHSPAP